MATKQSYHEVAKSFEETTDIVLEIEGLVASGTFIMQGVKSIAIDFRTISLALEQGGVEVTDAEILTDQFLAKVFQHQLAKVLAQRTKRVG